MKFTPMTEQDLQDQADSYGPWPKGSYNAEITSAIEKQSKAGNDMIALELKVYNANGDFRTMKDWLLEHAVPHSAMFEARRRWDQQQLSQDFRARA